MAWTIVIGISILIAIYVSGIVIARWLVLRQKNKFVRRFTHEGDVFEIAREWGRINSLDQFDLSADKIRFEYTWDTALLPKGILYFFVELTKDDVQYCVTAWVEQTLPNRVLLMPKLTIEKGLYWQEERKFARRKLNKLLAKLEQPRVGKQKGK